MAGVNLLVEKFRACRDRRKWTQEFLAEKTGLAHKTIVNLERGLSVSDETFFQAISLFDEEEQVELVIHWLRQKAGDFSNKIYVRKAKGLKGHEQLYRAFNEMGEEEKKEFLKAMERSALFLDTLKALNRTWDHLLKEAEKVAREIVKKEQAP